MYCIDNPNHKMFKETDGARCVECEGLVNGLEVPESIYRELQTYQTLRMIHTPTKPYQYKAICLVCGHTGMIVHHKKEDYKEVSVCPKCQGSFIDTWKSGMYLKSKQDERTDYSMNFAEQLKAQSDLAIIKCADEFIERVKEKLEAAAKNGHSKYRVNLDYTTEEGKKTFHLYTNSVMVDRLNEKLEGVVVEYKKEWIESYLLPGRGHHDHYLLFSWE